MSRNEERLGFPQGNEDTSADFVTTDPVESSQAPQLSWTTPTEFVSLPSRGEFYPATHPLHLSETIEIRYMTAKDEDILTSRALLKEGIAIDRLLENIIVNKEIDINSLLVGDKNALIVAARITGYGEDYETKVTCPSCASVGEHTFLLSLDPPAASVEEFVSAYDATRTENNTFIIALPLTQVNVECRLLNGHDEIKLMKETQRKARRKLEESVLTDQMKTFIVSVNGATDPLTISSFISSMPARDSRYLRTFYNDITPNLDLSQTYECPSCGYEADMEVPLTADFFWPKR